MDTTTRTLARRIALIACLAVAALAFGTQAFGASSPAAAPRPLTIVGATAGEEKAVDWAFHRYGEAGLRNMPPLDVHLYRDHGPCNGGLGLSYEGRIELCTKDSSESYQRKFALHEMAHSWIATNVGGDVLAAFMQRQGVEGWNDRSFPWKERGTEQAAEIITWGLGEGQIAPLLPETLDPAALTSLYEMLTGRAPITPAAA
jgi:hypothetical protein